MCVVKVNRVESKTLGFSKKDESSNSYPNSSDSLRKNDSKPDTPFDPQFLPGSGVGSRTPERLTPAREASQMHSGVNELSSSAPQELSACEDSSRIPPLDASNLSSSSHTNASSDTVKDLCPFDSGAQISSSSSFTSHTDSSMDIGSNNYTNKTDKTEKMDTVVDPKHIKPLATTEALYHLKTGPAEEGSYTSGPSFFSSQNNFSLGKGSIEEGLFPPLLHQDAADMPRLTPEPADKVAVCPLPPVLTQEMPSLTPADDRLTDFPKSTSYSHQIAPVLQRETPTGSLFSCEAKEEKKGSGLKLPTEPRGAEYASNWHLNSTNNCGEAAVSGLEGNTAHLTASGFHKKTSGAVREMLISAVAPEKDHSKLEKCAPGQSDASPSQLVHRTASQKEPQPNLLDANNSRNQGQMDNAITLNSAGSLLSGNSNNSVSAPVPLLRTQNNNHSASQLSHTTYSSSLCTSQNVYMESKTFSSSIWKNFSSQGPAVLTQSLPPELPSDFSHDPLPYTMWAEPQCKEVTDLEDAAQDLHQTQNQDEEGGPLTWAQLEPTSLLSDGAIEPLGLCGDYEPQKQRQAQESLHPGTSLSPIRTGGGEQDGVSDMEEGGSDGEDGERQSSAKEESSSESSEEEEEEENDTSNYECHESGLEPGEVCAVSVTYT